MKKIKAILFISIILCSILYVAQFPGIAQKVGEESNEYSIISVSNQLLGSEYAFKEKLNPNESEKPVWLEKTGSIGLEDTNVAAVEKFMLAEELSRFETDAFVKVQAIDLETQERYTNSEKYNFKNVKQMDKQSRLDYTAVKLTFDEDGELTIIGEFPSSNVASHILNTFEYSRMDAKSSLFNEHLYEYSQYQSYDDFQIVTNNYSMKPVTNLEVTYIIPNDLTSQYIDGRISGYDWTSKWNDVYLFNGSGSHSMYILYGFIACGVVALIMLFLPERKVGQIQPYKAIKKVPLELIGGSFLILMTFILVALSECTTSMLQGSYAQVILPDNRVLYYAICLAFSTALMFTVSMVVYLLKYILMNFTSYMKERSYLVRFVRWVFTLSFTPKVYITIAGIFVINLVILVYGSSGYYRARMIPAVLLFIVFALIMIHIFDRIWKNYKKVLNQSERVSQGDFTSTPIGDVQPFNEISEQLASINDGFKKAVDEEVKSQRMKTELITNVSHDLKTPLTSIISYVDLLKKEELNDTTKEYVEVLDRNSIRLKRLIEDLFEVSKAESGNVELHLEKIDIVNLLNQVLVETKDERAEQLDIRITSSNEHIYANLDANKMYRVFENLLQNIYKYALAQTRVYIDIKETDTISIVFRNISQIELDFDAQQLMNRFVQGDSSRSQEGSGLGLAIVKSFVELQGGEINIVVDGDLFKVELTFKKFE